MSKINTALDVLLEDVKMSFEHSDSISEVCKKISDLDAQSRAAKAELAQCIDSLCADLAKEIRKLQIDLNVTINRNGCNVGYRAKFIPCNVIATEKKWDFSGSDFGRMFSRRFPECCALDCSVPHLAKCLAEFFTNQYRSLHK